MSSLKRNEKSSPEKLEHKLEEDFLTTYEEMINGIA